MTRTAVLDETIQRNPCLIPSAGTPRADRQPVATPKHVVADLVDAIAPRYKATVALAAWGGLRRGAILTRPF